MVESLAVDDMLAQLRGAMEVGVKKFTTEHDMAEWDVSWEPAWKGKMIGYHSGKLM